MSRRLEKELREIFEDEYTCLRAASVRVTTRSDRLSPK